jgi:hypothetical protein
LSFHSDVDCVESISISWIFRQCRARGDHTVAHFDAISAAAIDSANAPAGDEPLSREQRRSRRKRPVRARTITVKRLSRRELEVERERWAALEPLRPKTRVDCVEGPRPCPHVSCRHHLYLDVSPKTGAIKLNFPDLEVWEMAISCALDVADGGGATLEDVGAILNLTRERIRQLELKALSRLEAVKDMRALRELVDPNWEP